MDQCEPCGDARKLRLASVTMPLVAMTWIEKKGYMAYLLSAAKLACFGFGTLILVFGFAAADDASNCATSNSPGQAYSVKLCISTPEDGANISDDATITAEITRSENSSSVQSVEFLLDSVHLLTDYAAPYTFILPSSHFADATRSLSVRADMRDGFETQAAEIHLVFNNGLNQAPAGSPNRFIPTSGSRPAAGQPFILAAAGDGASGETPEVTDLIASLSPNLFLYLGDVYEKGTYTEFYNWYGITDNFGQFRDITDPVIGNHEYVKSAAFGYQDYWNTRHDDPVYYSFNANGWHFIALNANSQVRQQPGSKQYQWLANDLANNTAECTLAYWHQPVYSIGPEPKTHRMEPIWSLLAQYHVDIVLNGHDHGYQRWTPLDGKGNIDLENGITEFVAGSGGHGIQPFISNDDRVVVGYDKPPSAFGALRFVLNPNGTTFEYVNIAGAILDSGTITCHGADVDSLPPNTPSSLGVHVDSFDHVVLNWLGATDNVGISGYTIYRDGQILKTTGRNELSYVDTDVALGKTYNYTVDAVDLSDLHSAPSSPVSVTLPAQATLTFYSDADSFIDELNAETNYGVSAALRTDRAPDIRGYIRFSVQGLPAGRVSSATLRIFSNTASAYGYDIHIVHDDSWDEKTLTYQNAPAFGDQLDFKSMVNANSWTTTDVGLAVQGNGVYTFGLSTLSPTALSYSSREGPYPPELVIELTE